MPKCPQCSAELIFAEEICPRCGFDVAQTDPTLRRALPRPGGGAGHSLPSPSSPHLHAIPRGLLFCGGALLALAAEAILWNVPRGFADLMCDLFRYQDQWSSGEFMVGLALKFMVGLALIVEGALAALGAALWLGRAFVPLTLAPARNGATVSGPAPAAVGGGPVLPICGILFLLAAVGPFREARQFDFVFDPGNDGAGRWIVWTDRSFGILWLVVGGALLGTPLFLKPRVWQLGWRMSRAGCGVAIGGLLLSGLGVLVWFANGMAMEARNMGAELVGDLGVLAGAFVAVIGGMIAVLRKSKAGKRPPM